MSNSIFLVASGFLGFLIAYVQPFVAVLKGRGIRRAVFIAWVLLLLYYVALCIGLPVLVNLISPGFTKEVFMSWVPEMPQVIGVLFLGWLPPFLAAAAGYAIRRLILRFWPLVFGEDNFSKTE